MQRVLKWRYYCDHCKKSGASGYHMQIHESRCTNNPSRKCGMCRTIKSVNKSMVDLLAAFGVGDEAGMERLRELADNCPACILATIRQSKVMADNYPDEEGNPPHMAWMDFSFKEEQKAFWADVNDKDIY